MWWERAFLRVFFPPAVFFPDPLPKLRLDVVPNCYEVCAFVDLRP